MNPAFLYGNNILNYTSLTATDTAAGYNILNVLDCRPYTLWKAASIGTKTIEVNFSQEYPATSIGLAGHNLSGGTIRVEVGLDVALGTTNITSNKIIFKIFGLQQANQFKIIVSHPTLAPQIGVIFMGEYLPFEYAPDTPFIPFIETPETDEEISKEGHLLGVNYKFNKVECAAHWSNLTRTWVDTNWRTAWDNYIKLGKPFFFGHDLVNAPNDVIFARNKGNYQSPISVLTYYDSIDLQMEGIR